MLYSAPAVGSKRLRQVLRQQLRQSRTCNSSSRRRPYLSPRRPRDMSAAAVADTASGTPKGHPLTISSASRFCSCAYTQKAPAATHTPLLHCLATAGWRHQEPELGIANCGTHHVAPLPPGVAPAADEDRITRLRQLFSWEVAPG